MRRSRLNFLRIFCICLFVLGIAWMRTNDQTPSTAIQSAQLKNSVVKSSGFAHQLFGVFKSVFGQSEHAVFTNEHPDIFSHPFENECKYPILQVQDENLKEFIRDNVTVECDHVQIDAIDFDDHNGYISVRDNIPVHNAVLALDCYYRPFEGGILPQNRDIQYLDKWKKIDKSPAKTKIDHDMFEVKCYQEGDKKMKNHFYRYAFAHVSQKNNQHQFVKSDRSERLSLNILIVDSTSLNMFKRHAPKTWRYMKDVMGFFHFEGYMKVGDNSMPNIMPLLTGLRYQNMSEDMLTDIPSDVPLDPGSVPWLWNEYKSKNCATLFNDDIAHWLRGFMNYPPHQARGFNKKPTDHFFRPWNLYHRRYPIVNSTKYCFGNHPYYKWQLRFTEQMVKRYRDTCHFSFNFLTDLTHDDTNNLQIIDDELFQMLKRLHEGKFLDDTALVIMGDHGNRIGLIRYSYVGRIEERMPFFGFYLPRWFQDRYPEVVQNLTVNSQRLVSHFDSHETFLDLLDFKRLEVAGNSANSAAKGISLFKTIPKNRTCSEANVPENHCTCMLVNRTLHLQASRKRTSAKDVRLLKRIKGVIHTWIREHWINSFLIKCNSRATSFRIQIQNATVYTTSQLVQHGIRNLLDNAAEVAEAKKKWLQGDIEYYEVHFTIQPRNVYALIRLQYNRKSDSLIVNVEPLFLSELKC